ncbi:Uncharacterized conserved protein [Bordetella ansorpii]|uniref:Uncharacterized conserved protein n=1 Tax=Bordetella ansorpii TaxID=288768 RepID=A0A157P6F9_9BORD|nr:DUF1801 domain-containing protein [Bordetella ansorpii]SAI28824.1 Uncharacterized conserved protein [Bordetella ansorpii]
MPSQTSRTPSKTANRPQAAGKAAKTAKPAAGTKKSASASASRDSPRLLSGGNPQIPKGDGDAPVQAYIAAMPEWKRAIGERLDALIVHTVPGVRKAVKWNTPFYGIEGQGWFIAFHCFTKYVKVTFFKGTSLDPPPPGESRSEGVRYLDIRQDQAIDDARLADWIRQASRLPGWTP